MYLVALLYILGTWNVLDCSSSIFLARCSCGSCTGSARSWKSVWFWRLLSLPLIRSLLFRSYCRVAIIQLCVYVSALYCNCSYSHSPRYATHTLPLAHSHALADIQMRTPKILSVNKINIALRFKIGFHSILRWLSLVSSCLCAFVVGRVVCTCFFVRRDCPFNTSPPTQGDTCLLYKIH